MSGTRSRILRASRDVVAEWNGDPKLQEVLLELRPGFAAVMDELAAAVYASGNQARLQQAAVEVTENGLTINEPGVYEVSFGNPESAR